MDKHLKLSESISINAPVAKVWAAITDKALIKEYFFGTDVTSDWKVGSPVIWSGEWEGQHYEEKGEILAKEQDKKLSFTYLSSGKEDKPENYSIIVYTLDSNGNGSTGFTVSQENFESQETCDHSRNNWQQVLAGLKKVAEKA
jgi:uncharacterized protein YndB with AHSA1/START domain